MSEKCRSSSNLFCDLVEHRVVELALDQRAVRLQDNPPRSAVLRDLLLLAERVDLSARRR